MLTFGNLEIFVGDQVRWLQKCLFRPAFEFNADQTIPAFDHWVGLQFLQCVDKNSIELFGVVDKGRGALAVE
jgi:hypothetical protein